MNIGTSLLKKEIFAKTGFCQEGLNRIQP